MDWTSIINNTVSTVGGILSNTGGSGGAQGAPPYGGLPPFNPYPTNEPTNEKPIDSTMVLIGLGLLIFLIKK